MEKEIYLLQFKNLHVLIDGVETNGGKEHIRSAIYVSQKVSNSSEKF
jgi:hypothetical protein